MFLTGKRPDREVIFVKPDRNSNEMELWLIEPKFMARVKRLPRTVQTADGKEYANLDEAARALLLHAGDELASSTSLKMPPNLADMPERQVIRMTMKQLYDADCWAEFAKMRGIDPDAFPLSAEFDLTRGEIETLRIGI